MAWHAAKAHGTNRDASHTLAKMMKFRPKQQAGAFPVVANVIDAVCVHFIEWQRLTDADTHQDALQTPL